MRHAPCRHVYVVAQCPILSRWATHLRYAYGVEAARAEARGYLLTIQTVLSFPPRTSCNAALCTPSLDATLPLHSDPLHSCGTHHLICNGLVSVCDGELISRNGGYPEVGQTRRRLKKKHLVQCTEHAMYTYLYHWESEYGWVKSKGEDAHFLPGFALRFFGPWIFLTDALYCWRAKTTHVDLVWRPPSRRDLLSRRKSRAFKHHHSLKSRRLKSHCGKLQCRIQALTGPSTSQDGV